jgi:hypothetical protein
MTTTESKHLRWTVSDLEGFAENGKRYKIIDEKLFITGALHLDHQDSVGNLYAALLSGAIDQRCPRLSRRQYQYFADVHMGRTSGTK